LYVILYDIGIMK